MVLLRSKRVRGSDVGASKAHVNSPTKSLSIVLSKSVSVSEECGDDLRIGVWDGLLRQHQDSCLRMLPGLLSLAFLASAMAAARYDVSIKVAAAAHDQVYKAKGCEAHYNLNHCVSSVPRMLTDCNHWHACMLAPKGVLVSRLAAETAAECLNSFVEPLSFKAAAVLLAALWTLLSSLRSAFKHSLSSTNDKYQGQHPHSALVNSKGNREADA